MSRFHDMTDAQIAEIARRCVDIVRTSKGKSWEHDVHDSVTQALTESRRESKVVKSSLTIEQRVARLEAMAAR